MSAHPAEIWRKVVGNIPMVISSEFNQSSPTDINVHFKFEMETTPTFPRHEIEDDRRE